MQIERGSPSLEEYILSVCLNNKTALAKSVSHLSAERDFSGQGQKAFGVLQSMFQLNTEIDPLVVLDKWTRLGIYDKVTAREIFACYNGDVDYEAKIQELRKEGIFRKAQKDIYLLNDMLKKDIEPDKLTSQAMDMVARWGMGVSKKYETAEEVEQQAKNQVTGKKLIQGIPLLDEVIYKYSGQHKGTVKATIFREKHGKTRHAGWEVAQDLRQGHKVLYITLEGQSSDITGNIRQVLQSDWNRFKKNLFLKDGTTDSDEIQGSIIEWMFSEKGDKVVIDYLQKMQQPNFRQISENVNSNRCCDQITKLAVKYDFHAHILAQARQSEKGIKGYENAPRVYDVYGSNQLIKDASIILIGFRPKNFEELIIQSPLGSSVKGPDGDKHPVNSVFVKPILARKKMEYLHKWIHFVDTDYGFKLTSKELL
jgi:hypothetical protein